jgi:hypothetical protein
MPLLLCLETQKRVRNGTINGRNRRESPEEIVARSGPIRSLRSPCGSTGVPSHVVAIPDPPDRGYSEHRARSALETLVGNLLRGIRITTLDELVTSDDGRDIQADMAIELSLEQNGDETVALFH